jgi:hypothetical protein
VAAVAFDRDLVFLVPGDNAEGTYHHASPAAYAALLFSPDEPIVVPVETSADAGVEARGVLAMPA